MHNISALAEAIDKWELIKQLEFELIVSDFFSMAKRVTQREVAKAANVSLSTVSLVFSDSPKIARATRDHVKAVASRLGYRPTPGLSAAMSARWQDREQTGYSRLGVVRTEDKDQRHFFHMAFEHHSSSFGDVAREKGYGFEFIDLAEHSPRSLRQRLEFLRVDGILFPMVCKVDADLMEILSSWPCVGIISKIPSAPIPIVFPSVLMNAFALYEEVQKRGYRRTGAVMQRLEPSRGVVSSIGGLLAARQLLAEENSPGLFMVNGEDYAPAAAYLQSWNCDSVIVGGSKDLDRIEAAWPGVRELGRAVLVVRNTIHSGFEPGESLILKRALYLLDHMIRHNINGAELSNLREEVSLAWQEGETLPRLPAREISAPA